MQRHPPQQDLISEHLQTDQMSDERQMQNWVDRQQKRFKMARKLQGVLNKLTQLLNLQKAVAFE